MKLILILSILLPVPSFANLVYEAQRKGVQLTPKDQEVLDVGEISTARYITGGILGTYPVGFGVGHAIQGRWSQQGWKFTLASSVSVSLMLAGLVGCSNDNDIRCDQTSKNIVIAGLAGFVGFRIWEIVDLWAVPPSHNQKYHDLKKYIDDVPAKTTSMSLDLAPLFFPRLGHGISLSLNF